MGNALERYIIIFMANYSCHFSYNICINISLLRKLEIGASINT